MLISCPECSTKFSIADAVLGDRGRKVRCFKCGHTWHQNPPGVGASAGQAAVAPAPQTPPQPRQPTQPLMPPTPTVGLDAEEPQSLPVAQPAASAAPAPAPFPMEAAAPVDIPPAAPAPPPILAASQVPLESDPLEGGFVPPAPPSGGTSMPLDSDPLAGVKPSLDDLDIPPSISVDSDAVTASGSMTHGVAGNDVDMDQLLGTSSEDIPKVFAKRMKTQEQKKSGVMGKLFFLLFLLAGLGATLWFARSQIVNRFPEAAKFYQMAGVPYEVLGEGLEFRGVTSEMTKRGKLPILIVRGVVANTVERERTVPLLRLVLLDSNGAMIQESYAKARRDTLAPGAQVGFQIKMEDPSAAAARYEVTFAEPPAESAEPEAHAPAGDAHGEKKADH